MASRIRGTKDNQIRDYVYWVICQYWKGFKISDIAKSIGMRTTYLYYLLNKQHIHLKNIKGRKITCKKCINYGISEIARELGISRQAVGQKVKRCGSPYCDNRRFNKGRPPKNKSEVK